MDDVSQKLQANNANIKVFGIGGGGLNAVNNMIRSGLNGVEFFAANTDAQALASALPTNKIRLGDDITKGLGAGADPDVGRAAARESVETIRKADDVLYQAVKGISDLIICEGLVNVDFADVRAVMSEMGMAMMGTGESSGDNRAIEAAEKAISSPLLEDISIHGARGVLINVTASPDVTLQEVNEAAELIHSEAAEDANIIWGMVIDPNLDDKVRVTVIATGFGDEKALTSETVVSSTTATAVTSALSTSGLDIPAFARKQQPAGASEVIKLKKLSVLSSSEDEEKFEIPTFLRKQAE